MEWIIEYLDEAADDLNKLDHSQQLHVLKATISHLNKPKSPHPKPQFQPSIMKIEHLSNHLKFSPSTI
jgi:mRNA-degrading endonuclease RelE of RelBE toxin-antitoxin system